MSELVKTSCPYGAVGVKPTFTTATASDYISVKNAGDNATFLLFNNADTHPATFTMKAGDIGVLAPEGDIVISIPASTNGFFVPLSHAETARVKLLEDAANAGANRGNILTVAATSGGTLSLLVAVVVIPK